MTDTVDPTPSDDERSSARLQAQLEALLDGRLDEAAADALRARIEREPAVRETWEELRSIQSLVRGYGPTGAALEVPPEFLATVKARIQVETSAAVSAPQPPPSSSAPAEAGLRPARRRPARMLRMLTVAYAAAALLVVGFTVRYVLDDTAGDGGAAAPETRTAKTEADKRQWGQPETGAAARDGAAPAAGAVREPADRPATEEIERELADRLGGVQPAKKAPDPAPAKPAGPAADTEQPGFFGPADSLRPGARPVPGARTEPKSKSSESADADDAQPRAPQPVRAGARRDADAALAKKLEGLTEARQGPVYVLEVADVAEARRELAALLGDTAQLDFGSDTQGRAGEKTVPATPQDAAKPGADLPSEEKSESEDDGDGDGALAGKLDGKSVKQATARFYRVDPAQVELLVAALRVTTGAAGGGKEKSRATGAPSADGLATAGPALLAVLTPNLDPAALQKLDARAVDGVWSGARLRGLVKKAAPAPTAAPTPAPGPMPTPTTPAGPARRKPAGADAPAAPGAAAPGPDDEDARAKRLRGRKAPATTAGEGDSSKDKDEDKASRSVRVRILLLERK